MSSANELKEQGNKLFIAGKFKEAVSFYTKAIVCFILYFEIYNIFFNFITLMLIGKKC